MSLPDEKYRAISSAREFLRSLLNPKLTPRVPTKVRMDTRWVLKHFPWSVDMKKTAEALPEIWGRYEKEDS